MHITISNELTEQIYGPIEVSDDMELNDLIALIEIDCKFNSDKNDLYLNMDILDLTDKKKTVMELGIKDDDLLLIRNKFTNTGMGGSGFSAATNPNQITDDQYIEEFRNELARNQFLRQQLTGQIPGLATMLEDPQMFRERMGPILLQRRYANNNPLTQPQSLNPFGIPQAEYEKIMNNPDDPVNKKRMEELINQQAIDEQLRNAYEYTPEVFTTVSMLYINLEINDKPVKAFVDTGAQMTIMSTRLADATGLTKLIDKRFVGEARGVGTGKIIGRIHQAQIKIETQYIPSSFVVLDTSVDLLIGLDMLKRHQATIDLAKNALIIAGVETKFLGESEIPKELEEEAAASASGAKPQVIQQPTSTASNAPASVPSTTNTNSSNKKPKTNAYPESAIKQLIDLGFSRQEVIQALDATGGNPEFAAALLFQ